MNECRDLEPLLAPYVDGESTPAESARIQAHAQACPCCRGRIERQQAARDAMCACRARMRTAAPDDLKSRCASYARAAASPGRIVNYVAAPKRVPLYRRWVPLTAAATLVLAVAAVFALGLNDKAHALAFQTTVDHAKCARFHLVPSPADPLATARKWQATFGWPIKVPPSSAENDLELRVVRRCAVTDGRVAHLIYMWKDEPLSLFVLPASVVKNVPPPVEQFGYRSTIWSQNNRTYMLVSERSDAELEPVIAYIRANAY